MGASSGLTFTILEQWVWGHKRVNLVQVACTTYGTDGILVTPALVGLAELDYVLPFFAGGAGAVGNGPVSVWYLATATGGTLTLYKASNSGTDAGTNITTAGYIYLLAFGS